MSGFETDDSRARWCENCLAMNDAALASIDLPAEGNVVVFDENSGRHMCLPCKEWGDKHLYPQAVDKRNPQA